MMLMLSGCHQLMLIGQIKQPTKGQIKTDVSFALDCFLRAYAPEPASPR
jgi:hypothetical protein